MKFAFLAIAAIPLINNLDAAWNVDSRCTRRRELEGFRFEEAEQRHKTKISGKNLRRPDDGHLEVDRLYVSNVEATGKAVSEVVDTHRELQSPIVFQLKIYWKEGYCWQEEWDERRWCLQCEGSTCGEDDYLLIEECSSSSRQRFIYQGGKLKPYTRQDLCWTRTRDNAHQLKPCGNDDTQFIRGIQYDGNFEMHPNGFPDDCLTNQHHPKSGEIIRRSHCEVARNDKTSLWVMINKEGGGVGGDGGGGDNGGGSGNTQDNGREHCDSTECGLCQGDCDSDEQCKGSLKCYQRGFGDPLPPGCSGMLLNTDTDFCYDPGRYSGGSGSGNTKAEDLGSEYCESTDCGLCQGDCDSDDQCAGSYKCYQRNSGDPLPRGCFGVSLSSNSDFCYDPGAYE